MNKYIVISILFVASSLFCEQVSSQNGIKNVLKQIEENNLTLKAEREKANIQQLDARVGSYLKNPDVEFEYMFGNRYAEDGNEYTFKVAQEFDFPTSYHHRGKVIGLKDKKAESDYFIARQNLLFDARQLCIEFVYLKKQQILLEKRYANADRLKLVYDKRLSAGTANVLDINKIKLELLNVKTEKRLNEVALNELVQQLNALNGNNSIDMQLLEYENLSYPLSFDDYYRSLLDKDLSIVALQQEKQISSREIQLAKSMALPKFSLGYQMESNGPAKYHGVVAGISIPLWENKKTVRRAQSQLLLSNLQIDDQKLKLHSDAKQQYEKVISLKELDDEYKRLLSTQDNVELLDKALSVGQISLLEYFNELIILYQNLQNSLDTERDFYLSVSALMKMDI